jgi:hypothetical protein
VTEPQLGVLARRAVNAAILSLDLLDPLPAAARASATFVSAAIWSDNCGVNS